MACCPSRVRYDSQEQSQLSNTVFQMEQQMMMLEGANMQAATVNALKAGNDAMKKQMKEMNVDAVQDVMDDVADQMEEMQEITEALGQDLSGGMFDESELEAEFADLEEELLDEQLLDISVRTLPRPALPHRSASHRPAMCLSFHHPGGRGRPRWCRCCRRRRCCLAISRVRAEPESAWRSGR